MEEPQAPKAPEDLVRWPGLGLIVVGTAHLVVSLFLIFGQESFAEWLRDAGQEVDPDFEMPSFGWGNTATAAFGVVLAGLVLAGGWSMLNRKSWTLALVAAVLTMIPCFGPCCGLGLPIGLFALVVLMRPPVRELFP